MGKQGHPVNHTKELWGIAGSVLSAEELLRLRPLCADGGLTYDGLVALDAGLGGPSLDRINRGNTGNYEGGDRDVFRSLQYCCAYFGHLVRGDTAEWLTREIVHMSSAHLEGLVKRIGTLGPIPLGAALTTPVIRTRLDPDTWKQLRRVSRIYNAAKHNFEHPPGTHMFSVQDAVLAYVVCRKLGNSLLAIARLKTPLCRFD